MLLGFDDGFKNVIRYALPVLDEFKVPAVFFVIGRDSEEPQFCALVCGGEAACSQGEKKDRYFYDNTYLDLSLQEDGVRLRGLFDASIRASKSEADRQKLLTHLAELLCVDRPEGPELDEDLKFVDREDLISLPSSSRLTVASHAMTHRYLATHTTNKLMNWSRAIFYCRSIVHRTTRVVAYPLGSFNDDTSYYCESHLQGGLCYVFRFFVSQSLRLPANRSWS